MKILPPSLGCAPAGRLGGLGWVVAVDAISVVDGGGGGGGALPCSNDDSL